MSLWNIAIEIEKCVLPTILKLVVGKILWKAGVMLLDKKIGFKSI